MQNRLGRSEPELRGSRNGFGIPPYKTSSEESASRAARRLDPGRMRCPNQQARGAAPFGVPL
eukprot:3133916-Alexandrium_andersonii.AAC.1